MSYTLDSTVIRRPVSIKESSSTQYAQQRALSGAIGRDYFGSTKRIWTLEYRNAQASEYNLINAIYTSYIATATGKTWSSDESNYTIASTTVHVDLVNRGFTIAGTDYLSNFTLTLTEV